jgi:isocitrate dehydrogenase
MTTKTPITVAYGDGIGPEIMQAALSILEAGGAQIEPEYIEIGEKVYMRGISAGIEDSSWASLRKTKVFYKAPITTPQGGGYKSLNVTVRKTLGQFANVRPCVSLHPFVKTNFPGMDVVIIRENEEDLYAGIEYKLSDDVYQSVKLISRPGSERIIRYAFEYARRNGRKKVTCMSKDNIMKMADGCFHSIFKEVAKEYPEITADHMIIDIGTARIAARPTDYDVVVTLNLYGDIISDVAAEVTGSVGLATSANIGDHVAMFEAIHGSAPTMSRDSANPSGLLLAGVMMLVHIGQADAASRVHNAWMKTLEDGVHTKDVYQDGVSKRKVGTAEFAEAVIARMGQTPTTLPVANYKNVAGKATPDISPRVTTDKKLVGIDFYIVSTATPNDLAAKLKPLEADGLHLSLIDNRGVKVWPDGHKETFCTDAYRCRFLTQDDASTTMDAVLALTNRIHGAGLPFSKIEMLQYFGKERGFTLGQGE